MEVAFSLYMVTLLAFFNPSICYEVLERGRITGYTV